MSRKKRPDVDRAAIPMTKELLDLFHTRGRAAVVAAINKNQEILERARKMTAVDPEDLARRVGRLEDLVSELERRVSELSRPPAPQPPHRIESVPYVPDVQFAGNTEPET